MEEVVLGIELLVLIAKFAAPFTQLVYGLLHPVALEVLQAAGRVVRIQAAGWVVLHVVALQLEKLFLKVVVLLVRRPQLLLLVRNLALEPLDLVHGLLLLQLGLLKVPSEVCALVKGAFLVHRDLVLAHLELHPKLHQLLILADHFLLRLRQRLALVTSLSLVIGNLRLQFFVDGLYLADLGSVLLSQACQVAVERLNQLLLVTQLLLDHLELLAGLLQRCVVLRRHF